MVRKLSRFSLAVLEWLAIICLGLYGAGAIYYCAPVGPEFRAILSVAFALGTLAPLFLARTWKRRLIFILPLLVCVYGWYLSIKPMMDAPWGKDVAVLPDADVVGDKLIVHKIRNFNYRSDTDFDVRYYDKTFDLTKLQTVDLFLSYWGTTSIAHTIMSFGFEGGDQLAISIETRKKIGEEYSAVQGFFKKFELVYVLADERDVIGVRVNHRNEDVYLYRLKVKPENVRKFLLDYIKSVDSLERTPQFYNALLTNCTTSILPHIAKFQKLKFNWALIANGYIDKWRYDEGVWGFDIPFDEFRKRSHVNDRVKAAGNAENFSEQIRVGLPSIK